MNSEEIAKIEEAQKKACPACQARRTHTEEEWRNHPYRGHGYSTQTGYTHPDLKP